MLKEPTTLTGKALISAALRHEPVARAPWVPFAGVHAGLLKGYDATEVLTDGDKLYESLMAAHELYQPDGMPVIFDLQIEAEILGCDLLWAEKAPPTVASHSLMGTMDIPTKLPTPEDGRLPMVLDVMQRMKQSVGTTTALYGLVCGPFTLASHLRGTEIFMDMMLNPDHVHALMYYATQVTQCMINMYIEAGMDVIALVDPMVSQIGPNHFNEFLAKPFEQLFDSIREQGVFSSMFVCGDATKNLDPMCKTKPDSLSIDENIDLLAAKEVTDKYNVTIGGNIPLTTTMLLGTQKDNMKFAVDLLDSLPSMQNFILAPGCDMPYDVPIENTIGITEAVHNQDATRQMLASYESPDIFNIDVEMPDYATLEKPLVEVFTLDSSTCAACMYMLGAAQRGYNEMAGKVDMIEYKFTEVENVARCQKMGVANLPSIYINGELAYSSIIPSAEELRTKLANYLD